MKQMAAAAVRKMRCCKRSSLLVVTLDCNGLRIFLSLENDEERNMATIKDIAARAGVTATTVSRVINNRGYIREETRKKVTQAMQEMNYQPNELARSAMSLIVAMFLSSSFSNCFSLSPIIAQKICFR